MIKGDSHRLGMAGLPSTHGFVCRTVQETTDVTGLDRFHTFNLVIHRFKTPKTAAGEDGDFLLR